MTTINTALTNLTMLRDTIETHSRMTETDKNEALRQIDEAAQEFHAAMTDTVEAMMQRLSTLRGHVKASYDAQISADLAHVGVEDAEMKMAAE